MEREENKSNRIERILRLYQDIIDDKDIYLDVEAERYGTSAKSIKRDIMEIDAFVDEHFAMRVLKDDKTKAYRLNVAGGGRLTQTEVLAICNILLNSRAFSKEEMDRLLEKIIEHNLDKDDRKLINTLTGNEKLHYTELNSQKDFFDNMSKISEAIDRRKKIETVYIRGGDMQSVTRKLCPVALMFSDMYFYVAAKIEDEEIEQKLRDNYSTSPAIYRLDRMTEVVMLDETYNYSEKDKFEAGEFKKKSKFMYGGNIRHLTFEFTGKNIGMILDHMPTAKIREEGNGKYLISAEVIGNGAEIWLRTQGDAVKIIPPQGNKKED